MTDDFNLDARIDDRIEGLWRVLGDPHMSRDLKVAEIQSAFARIELLESDRLLAESLSVIADALSVPGRDEE